MVKIEPPYQPYICQEAVDYFASILQPYFYVFEYGAGASTLWLAQRVAWIVSVESDAEWLRKVSSLLGINRKRVHMHHVLPGKGKTIERWDDYADIILDYADDAPFDLVFVDGYSRLRCIRNAVPKVKPGGWLVLDDSNWARLRPGLRLLSGLGWSREERCGEKVHRGKTVYTCTSFFRKPRGGL